MLPAVCLFWTPISFWLTDAKTFFVSHTRTSATLEFYSDDRCIAICKYCYPKTTAQFHTVRPGQQSGRSALTTRKRQGSFSVSHLLVNYFLLFFPSLLKLLKHRTDFDNVLYNYKDFLKKFGVNINYGVTWRSQAH